MPKAKKDYIWPPFMIEENEFLNKEEMRKAAHVSNGELMTLSDGKQSYLVRRKEWIDYCNAKGRVP